MTRSVDDDDIDAAFRARAADAVAHGVADMSAMRPAVRRTRLRRTAPTLAAAGVVLLVAIGAAFFADFRSEDEPPTAAASPAATAPTAGPAESEVTARLVLESTTAPADGTPLTGRVFITNSTGERIPITNACNGWVDVGLVNDKVSFEPAHTARACATAYLPTGVSSTRVELPTTYLSCRQGRSTGAPDLLPCTGPTHSGMPSLEPGVYRTKIVFADVAHYITTPGSTQVMLTRP